MKKTEQVKLIDGTFSPENAAEVLHAVLDDKIRFHNIRILSIQERFGGDTSASENRLRELKAAKAKVSQILAEAKAANLDLEIFSCIDIKFVESARGESMADAMTAEV